MAVLGVRFLCQLELVTSFKTPAFVIIHGKKLFLPVWTSGVLRPEVSQVGYFPQRLNFFLITWCQLLPTQFSVPGLQNSPLPCSGKVQQRFLRSLSWDCLVSRRGMFLCQVQPFMEMLFFFFLFCITSLTLSHQTRSQEIKLMLCDWAVLCWTVADGWSRALIADNLLCQWRNHGLACPENIQLLLLLFNTSFTQVLLSKLSVLRGNFLHPMQPVLISEMKSLVLDNSRIWVVGNGRREKVILSFRVG